MSAAAIISVGGTACVRTSDLYPEAGADIAEDGDVDAGGGDGGDQSSGDGQRDSPLELASDAIDTPPSGCMPACGDPAWCDAGKCRTDRWLLRVKNKAGCAIEVRACGLSDCGTCSNKITVPAGETRCLTVDCAPMGPYCYSAGGPCGSSISSPPSPSFKCDGHRTDMCYKGSSFGSSCPTSEYDPCP